MTKKINADGEIVEASRGYGWISDAWQKDPLRFGFSEQYLERETDTGDGSDLDMDFSVVPAGEVWVVTAFACVPVSDDHVNVVFMGIYNGAISLEFAHEPSLALDTALQVPLQLILIEGDNLRVRWESAANGDVFYAWANGYKMLIAE
jgi:hypothetical protein